MRVVLTVPHLVREFGGPATKATHLTNSLNRLGWETEVIGSGAAEGATGLGNLGHFHSTPIPRRVAPIQRAVRRADVVHILGYRDPVGTIAARSAKRAGIPYLLEPVGMFGPKLRSHQVKAVYEKLIGASIVAGADLLIATSRIEEEDFIAGGVEPDRVALRPNGVSVDDLLPLPPRGAFRSSVGIPMSAPFVLTIGRISINKGLLGLIRAAESMEGVHFVVAGPDNRDGTLQAMQRERVARKLEDRFTLLPKGVWRDEKKNALADADCFCLPSETESFGIAAAEAAALGIPTVISDRCGAAPWLMGERTKVFAFGDTLGLVDALRAFLDDLSGSRSSERSGSSIRKRLGWDAIAAQQVLLYEQVLTARTPRTVQ